MLTTELDPYRPGYFDNPFAWTAGLRSTGQVLRDPRFGCSYVAGFDEARAVLHDKQRFSARGQFLLTRLDEAVRRGARAFDPASVTATAPPSLSYLDPPLLNRTRRLLLPVFGSRAAATFGPTQLYERTIGAVATDHEIDVVSVASSLSRAVLADFLGLPASSARVLADALGPGDGSSAADPTGRPSSRALRSYTSSLCRDPGTSGVLAELMALLAEAGIPESQAVSVASETALAVLVTSHQSLVRATVNLVRLLATRPDVWEDLRAGAATAAAVVEEGLRLEGATLALGRQATEPTVVGSDEVPAGTLLVVLLGSANRDCRRFPQGDELDPSRADNGHLAFAAGPHLCMGAAMGRRHLGQFLQAAAARWPAIRLAFEAHARRDLLVRCFDRLVLLPPVHRSARHRRRAVPLADRRRRLRGSALAAPLRRFTPTAGTPASESGSSTS